MSIKLFHLHVIYIPLYKSTVKMQYHKHSIVKEHKYQRHMVWALHLIISISE